MSQFLHLLCRDNCPQLVWLLGGSNGLINVKPLQLCLTHGKQYLGIFRVILIRHLVRHGALFSSTSVNNLAIQSCSPAFFAWHVCIVGIGKRIWINTEVTRKEGWGQWVQEENGKCRSAEELDLQDKNHLRHSYPDPGRNQSQVAADVAFGLW